jgi:hypothetical protein
MKKIKRLVFSGVLSLLLVYCGSTFAADLTCTDIGSAMSLASAYDFPGLDETHAVEYCGAEAWFAVDLVAGHGYSILLGAHLSAGELDFGLFEADGVTEVVGSNDTRIGDGQVGIGEKTIGRSGTYFIKVWEYAGSGAVPAVGGYDLTMLSAWFNPGTLDSDRNYYYTLNTARYIANGTYVADDLGTHFYRFTAQAGTPVVVTLSATIAYGELDFGIFAPDGREIAGSNDATISNGQTGVATAAFLTGGLYYVKVWENGNDPTSGTYVLSISGALDDTDTDEDNLSDAAEYYHGTDIAIADTDGDGVTDFDELTQGSSPAIVYGYSAEDLAGAISPASAFSIPAPDAPIRSEYANTETWYSINLIAGQGVTIVLGAHMNSGELDFGLFASDGVTEIAGSNDTRIADGEVGVCDKTVNRSGTFYLKVFRYGSAVADGSYDLAVYNAWYNPGTVDADRSFFNSLNTARYAAPGMYNANDLGNHAYRFIAQKGTPVEVTVTAHIGTGDLDFGIFAADGIEVAGSNDASIANGQTGTATAQNLIDGVYYVKVWKNTAASGTYDLTIFGAIGDLDSDADNLSDAAEYHHHTAVDAADTDGDGVPDPAEISSGSSPVIATELTCAAGLGAANTMVTAFPLPIYDETFRAEICSTDTWYKFDLVAGQGISLTLTPHVDIGRMHLYFYDEDANQLASSTYITNGTTAIINYTPVVGDTFYVRVVPIEGAYGDYDFAACNAWFNAGTTDGDRDFYGSFHTAGYIAAGNNDLTSRRDIYYRFAAHSGVPFAVSLTPHITVGRMHLYLYDKNGTQLGYSTYIINGSTGTITCTPVVSGVYYVKLQPIENAFGHYDITLSPSIPGDTDSDAEGLFDAAEYYRATDPNRTDTDNDGLSDYDEVISGRDPNYNGPELTCDVLGPAGSPALAYPVPIVDTPFRSGICSTETWYKFDMPAGQGFSVTLTPHVNVGRMHLNVYEPGYTPGDGAMASATYLTNGTTGIVSYTPTVGGTHYVRVVPIEGAKGNYDLAVYNAWFNCGATDTMRDFFGSYPAARYIEEDTFEIKSYKDAYYRFTAQSGVPFSISLTPHVPVGRMHLYLYDQFENQLSFDTYITNGSVGVVAYTPVIGGLFYVKVQPIENAYGSYDIAVSPSIQENADTDGDGLSDAAEFFHKTAVDATDTDDDGQNDCVELSAGRDPLFKGIELTCDDVGLAGSLPLAYPLPVFDEKFRSEICSTGTWYGFDLAAGQGVTLTLSPHVNKGYAHLHLYAPGGTVLSSATYIYNGATKSISFTPTAAGRYYARIVPSAKAGYYDLAVYNAWFNYLTTDCERDYFSTPYTARQILDDTYPISPYGEEDYRLFGTSGELFAVSFTLHVNLGRAHMYLLDQNGTILQSSTYITNGVMRTISYTPSADAPFYIRVVPIEGAYGHYDLDLTGLEDSDKDFMLDAWEMHYFCHLLRTGGDDYDGDGLSDLQEHDYLPSAEFDLNPTKWDTDDDGMPDGWETAHNLDPLLNDCHEDPDDDDVTNCAEYANGIDPHDWDTDDDLMSDGCEVAYNLNPLVNDADADPDGDNLINIRECDNGTNPHDRDTDGDGMPDGWEADNNTNPLEDDALTGYDEDGYCNLREFLSGTDPWNSEDIPDILCDYEPDGDVDGADLFILQEQFNHTDCDGAPCFYDLDADGDVDSIDIRLFGEDYGRSDSNIE